MNCIFQIFINIKYFKVQLKTLPVGLETRDQRLLSHEPRRAYSHQIEQTNEPKCIFKIVKIPVAHFLDDSKMEFQGKI